MLLQKDELPNQSRTEPTIRSYEGASSMLFFPKWGGSNQPACPCTFKTSMSDTLMKQQGEYLRDIADEKLPSYMYIRIIISHELNVPIL